MEKTKIGISVGLFAAATYLLGLFGGYVVIALVAGYVFLKEDSAWLKKQCVRTVALMLLFSLANGIVGLIPEFFSIISNIIGPFSDRYVSFSFADRLYSILYHLLNIGKVVLFVLLALGALKQAKGKLPVIDDLIDKYLD